jgi:aspartate carbamoyltransferase catalytic subunit
VGDLRRTDIDALIARGQALADGVSPSRHPFVAGLFFLQESTRTRVGFEAAIARLGGTAITITATKRTPSMSAAESWADTVRSVGSYLDLMCIRHPDPHAAAEAANLVPGVPVVNCGNGIVEHPTQALLDVLAFTDHLGRTPDGMHIALVGDLRHMRSAHSLLQMLPHFEDIAVTAVCPAELAPHPSMVDALREAGHRYRIRSDLSRLEPVDVLYACGFVPRTPDHEWTVHERAPFRITPELVHRLPPETGIFCPLPRIDEISAEVDALPQARYFRQSQLGVPMRMAIVEWCLGAIA